VFVSDEPSSSVKLSARKYASLAAEAPKTAAIRTTRATLSRRSAAAAASESADSAPMRCGREDAMALSVAVLDD